MSSDPALYAPYKAVGVVTDGRPFFVHRLGEENFIYASIGNAFQVFRFDKLTVCLASRSIPALPSSSSSSSSSSAPGEGEIQAICAIGKDTFVAARDCIFVYNRTNIVRTYENPRGARVLGLCAIGKYLLSFDDANAIDLYDIQGRVLVHSMNSLQQARISAIYHPATYLNKILVLYSNGTVELWNFMKRNVVYTFQSIGDFFGARAAAAKSAKKIEYNDMDDESTLSAAVEGLPSALCVQQSPVSDIVALGFASGDILLLHMKQDKVLFSFKQEGSAVTSLSFRTDIGAEAYPYLASGSADGRIHIWSLGKAAQVSSFNNRGSENGDDSDSETKASKTPKLVRKLEYTMEEAHRSRVSRVEFLHGEPILISSAEDNSLKVWIFDAPDGSARLLRSREGHSGPSLRIRYYGGVTNVSMADNADATSCELISAGQDDSLRYFNTAVESQNREMSQKPILKRLGLLRRHERLPTTLNFDFCETRQRDWGNMVTIHRNHANAYVWKYKDRVVMGDVILRQPNWKDNEKSYSLDRSTHSTAVAVSTCGNYAIVGSRGGVIYKYNIQSGLPRGTYPVGYTPKVRLSKQSNIDKIMNSLEDQDEDPLSAVKAHAKSEFDPNALDGHTAEVTGLFVDLTSTVIVSCGLDGQIIFWDFNTHKILSKISVDSPQIRMVGFKDGSYVAVCGQDRITRIYDIPTKKLARRFMGHSREVTDMAFTPDGRRFLTCSLDSTIRTWDMATGRCLSWVSFKTPVLSIAMSLSGEYVCVSRAEADGIFMFIDKSLYESVHFWREPEAPTPISDSGVAIDDVNYETGEYNVEPEADGEGDVEITVKPTQGQVVTEDATNRESAEQRGDGSITLSAIPRAYWVTLFNLEEIKERNKAKAPPSAPVNAPFFLPTIYKEGATPTFPTPEEFANMLKSGSAKDEGGSKSAAGQKRALEGGEANAAKASKTEESEEAVIAQLASFGGDAAWDDDGDDDEEEEVEQPVQEKPKSRILHSGSKILKRQSNAPRCTLVAFIMRDFPGAFTDDQINSAEEVKSLIQHLSRELAAEPVVHSSFVLDYFKKTTPPEIDIEMRLLCRHEEDSEGLQLLRLMLLWFCQQLRSGQNFEVLQAYLHRFLTIYSDTLINTNTFADDLSRLASFHEQCCGRFRHLVQKNLCLLKMLANLPSI